MGEVNPFQEPPVYKIDQVLTLYDVMGIRNGYIYQYKNLHWYNLKRKWMLRVGIGVCNALLHWLYHGKPVNGVQCREDNNHGV